MNYSVCSQGYLLAQKFLSRPDFGTAQAKHAIASSHTISPHAALGTLGAFAEHGAKLVKSSSDPSNPTHFDALVNGIEAFLEIDPRNMEMFYNSVCLIKFFAARVDPFILFETPTCKPEMARALAKAAGAFMDFNPIHRQTIVDCLCDSHRFNQISFFEAYGAEFDHRALEAFFEAHAIENSLQKTQVAMPTTARKRLGI